MSSKFAESSEAGREYRVNSIFTNDNKQKLYINLDTGLWTDFKSGEKGNFCQLIAHIENVPYSAARHYINKLAFDKGVSLFDVSTLSVDNKPIKQKCKISDDVHNFLTVNPTKDRESPHFLKRLAAKFACGRKLTNFKFYVGKAGRYFQRIIIPYEYRNNPFYFQARALTTQDPKYLNPSRNLYGIKTSEILYPYDESLPYVFVAEGPLDAMSLIAAGFNSTCTQGCKMSTVQARALKDKKVIIAYDNDESGRYGFSEAKKRLLSQRNPNIYSLCPPKDFNDWNDFWVGVDKATFTSYVKENINKADWELDLNERLA